MRNIELKARLADLEAARRVAAAVATEHVGTKHQVDTYFHCRQGRLKLRETDAVHAELVWYARADSLQSKPSDYWLVPVADPQSLKAALAAALGVRSVVDKRREIFLWHDANRGNHVRIHLDDVVGLGSFLEFEAVLGPGADDAAGRAQLEELSRRFGVRPEDCLPGSYGEMVLVDRRAAGG